MVPEGWAKIRFEEVGGGIKNAIVDGPFGSNLKSEHYRDKGIPVFQSGFVTDGTFNPTKYVYVDEGLFAQQYRSAARGGDILMAKIGAQAGRCAVIPDNHEEGILAGNSLKITPAPDSHDRDFILHWLTDHYNRTGLSEIKSTTAQPAISIKNLKRLWFMSPPLPEQRKIADILSTWDAAIEKTVALLATAKAQKRALMQSLLTGKRRFPEFEGQPWKEVRIGDVAREVSERNKDEAALTVMSCTKSIGFVNSLDYFKKKVFSDDLSGYKIIRRNQIGYPSNHVEEGSIGVQNLHDAALVSPIYTIFETGPEADPMYLFRVLKTDRYRQIFAAATSASVDRRGSLRWKAFATIKVRLPSLHEQRRINETLSTADNEISELETSVAKLRTEKKALMQQLLTGKRRVTL